MFLLLLAAALPLSAQDARLQLIHNSGDIDAASLEVLVNGDSTTTFSFRGATAFIDYAPGEYVLRFVATILTETDTSAADTVTLAAGTSYVGIVSGITATNIAAGKYDNPHSRDIDMNLSVIGNVQEVATDGGMVDVIAFHGSTDSPALDIVNHATGTPAFDDLDYGQASAYISVTPTLSSLDITPANDNSTVIGNFEADLSALAGQSLVLVASGFLDPDKNESAQRLGLFAAKADGGVVNFKDVTPGEPGPWTDAGDADWRFDGFLGGDSLADGGHGIVVDKLGRIWVGNYYASLRVVDANGVDAPFSPIDSLKVDAAGIAVLASPCRGLAIADDGNILFARSGGHVIKVNVETGEGMAHYLHSGCAPLKPAIDSNGYIYVGSVCGINPIDVLDPNSFEAIQTITLDIGGYGRGMEVRSDGKTIYTPDLGGSGGPVYVWTSTDLVTYSKTDSIKNNTEGESIFQTQRTTFDWGPDSLLWVSSDAAYSPANIGPNGFVILNFEDMSYTFLRSPVLGEGIGNGPRGVAFSATGDTAYATYFGWRNGGVSRFIKGAATSVKGDVLPSGYELAQNYPNPFNPTTNISFKIAQSDKVSLKIYNTLGQEVATVLDDKRFTAGRHVVNFDASNLASGVYFYKLQVNKLVATMKMTLMK
jgi:hypothetical protein